MKRLLLSSGFLSLSLHATGLGVRLLFMLALLEFSGVKQLGEFGLLVSIELVTVYLAGFEFHSFTTRRYARNPNDRKLKLALASHKQVLLLTIPMAAIVSASGVWLLDLNLSVKELLLFLSIVITGSVVQEANRFLVMTQKSLNSIVVSFIRTAGWMPPAILLATDAIDLELILIFWCAGGVTSAILACFLLKSAIDLNYRVHLRYLTRGLYLSRRYYIIANGAVLRGNLDRFVLQNLLGPEAVGLFTFFQTIANTVSGLVQSGVLNQTHSALLTGFAGPREARFTELSKVVRRTIVVGFVVCIMVILAGIGLLVITDRSQQVPHLWILFWLILGQFILLPTNPVQTAVFAAHNDATLMWMSISVFLFSILLSIALVATIGVTGAVFSQLVICVITAIARCVIFLGLKSRGRM